MCSEDNHFAILQIVETEKGETTTQEHELQQITLGISV